MNSTDKELTFEVTEAEFEEGLAKGWTGDDMLKPGIYKVRRARRFRQKPEAKKVQVTIEIDDDVLKHFRQQAEQPNAATAEEQINSALRAAMEHERERQTA